jgi:hypothetical protein
MYLDNLSDQRKKALDAPEEITLMMLETRPPTLVGQLALRRF